MKENNLTKDEVRKVRKVFFIYLIIALVVVTLLTAITFIDESSYYNSHEHWSYCYAYEYEDDAWLDELHGGLIESKMDCFKVEYESAFSYALDRCFDFVPFGVCLIILLVLPLIGFLHSRAYARRIEISKLPPVPVKEYRVRCNVCGHVYCYTDNDLSQNVKNAGLGLLGALGALFSIFGGTIFHTHHLQRQSDRYLDKTVDFEKCPNCNSRNITVVAEEIQK